MQGAVTLKNGTSWIKDFFTPSGNLTARFYRVSTEPRGKYELMYSGCVANISIYFDGYSVSIGSIKYSLKNSGYDNLFYGQVKSQYQIPKYVSEYVLSYFRKRSSYA